MAAIAYPVPAERRPHLVLVPPYEGPTRRVLSRRSTLRRRRLAVLAAMVLLALALQFAVHTASAWLGGGSLAASEPRSAAAAPAAAVYVVQPGDTLWTLARRSHPAGDLRPVVGRLAAALGDRPLRAGQRIVLP
jgi:nucleoid-associated protein YgaU